MVNVFWGKQISDKFSIYSEFQFRNDTITPNNTKQWLLRLGLNYHFSKKIFVTAWDVYSYISI